MPTYYTLHCHALLQPVRTCFVNYMQQFFVSPPPKPSKNDIASSATMIDFKSSLPDCGGEGDEKNIEMSTDCFLCKKCLFTFVPCRMDVTLKKCIGDGYSSSVFTPTLLLTGSSKENEFPWELFWALFFFLHALKNRVEQHDMTPKTVKCFCVPTNNKAPVLPCLSRLIWINVASNHCCPRLTVTDTCTI